MIQGAPLSLEPLRRQGPDIISDSGSSTDGPNWSASGLVDLRAPEGRAVQMDTATKVATGDYRVSPRKVRRQWIDDELFQDMPEASGC